jgi:Domain of unknown function (DUF5668)
MAQNGYPRRSSLVFPILLIAVGAIILYGNWRPSFDPWPVLWRYWPLILIFIGIGKIWDSWQRRQNPDAPPQGGSSFGTTLGAVLFVVVLLALLVNGHRFSRWRNNDTVYAMQHQSRTVDRGDAKNVRATIDMGAGHGNLRLRDIDVTRLNLNIGAGQVDVDLTGDRTSDLTADIEGGVGEANIRLPKNVGVLVNASGGLGTIDAHGLNHDGNEYTNALYGKSPVTIRLKVEGGVGRIVLTEEP